MIWFSAKTVLGAALRLFIAAAIAFFALDLASGQAPGWTAANERFWHWIGTTVLGNFGTSRALDAPVTDLLVQRLAVTAPLIALALVLAGAAGVGVGYAAGRARGVAERALIGLARALGALPDLWIALMLGLIFATSLHWLPSGGFVQWASNPAMSLLSLLLPAVALALPASAQIALAVHGAIVAARDAPYMRAALAHGLDAEQAFRQHALRNAAGNALEDAGPALQMIVPASVVVEAVFYLPGLGRLMLDGAMAGDVPVVAATLVVVILGLVVVSVAIRIGRALIDPRLWRRAAP